MHPLREPLPAADALEGGPSILSFEGPTTVPGGNPNTSARHFSNKFFTNF